MNRESSLQSENDFSGERGIAPVAILTFVAIVTLLGAFYVARSPDNASPEDSGEPDAEDVEQVATISPEVSRPTLPAVDKKAIVNPPSSLGTTAEKLSAELRMALKAGGISRTRYESILKEIEMLETRGLPAETIDELHSILKQLSVGEANSASGRGENAQSAQRSSGSPGCPPNSAPQFTHAFTDLSVIDALNPIGRIGGGSPGRSYIGVKAGMEAPVYAPSDAILERIISVDRGAGYPEYGVFLTVACDVEILFDHIDRLTDAIKRYAPEKPAETTIGEAGTEPRVPIAAGTPLGYTNGTDLARTWDFLVTNHRKKNAYINPKRWEWDQAVYGTCPYDYFIPDLKAQYYAKLGKPSDTGLIKADSCGNPSHDVAGTASGGWFKGESTDKRGEYLAIARQYDDVMVAYRKDGDAFASREDVQRGKPYLQVTDMNPRKYPADIKPGDSVCYSGNNQWALIRLDSATQLSLAHGSGECPSAFPESQAEVWER